MAVLSITMLFLLLGISCTEETVQTVPIAQITTVDIGVTEVWLRISMSESNDELSLFRNDSLLVVLHSPVDTVLYDSGLLPNHTYTYKAGQGAELSLTTMDTTSHEFTWETTVLGDGNFSTLYDVAIINDSLAYAVGEIYLRDSSGMFETEPFNVAIWNGIKWEFNKIYYAYQGNNYLSRLTSVFAFGENDIWLGSNQPQHWNGSTWEYFVLAPNTFSGWINKMWGNNSSNLYIVGNDGAIARFNGSTWQKIESGTTTHINDAWGVTNAFTKKVEIFCPVTDGFAFKDRKILKITNTSQIDSIRWTPQREVSSLWSHNGLSLFAGGDGVFENHNGVWRQVDIGVNIYTNHIRGNALNNIFAVGPLGLISHNNGVSWKLMTGIESGSYTSVSMKEDLVIAVGTTQNSSKAFVAIGKRN